MKKLDAAAKSTYGSLAKTSNVADDVKKSTETNESTEGEQTDTEAEKRAETAENDVKMSVVGENSETADLSALDIAIAMHKADPNANTVSKTGWWLGKDNKWRYEIADNEMRFERDGLYRNPQTLEDYIEHDKLFDAYPHLKNIRVKFERVVDGDHKINGQYDAVNNVITLKSGRSNEDTKRTLIHEIQHAVQEHEGFLNGFNTNGGYIEWFNRVFDNVKETREYKSLKTPEERWDYVENIATLPGEGAIDKTAKSLYRNNYGEIEARATAERLDMNEEQRKKSPIVNDGNTYSLQDIHSKFVDNLRLMGYTDTQIQEKINGEKTNGRTKEIGSGTRRRNIGGRVESSEYIESNRQSTQSSRNLNSRGEGKNTQNLHDGRIKHSTSPETDASYLSAVENGDMETAQRMVVEEAKDIRYSLSGYTADGIEVYETSEEVLNLPWKERKKRYLSFIEKQYRGRTAKFERNGHVYYAEFDRQNASKAIFGDSRSDDAGRDALINTGADGDIFKLVENSNYDGSGKDKKNHNNTDYFDYFVKTVQIDGKVFDLLADVKKQYGKDGGYVYTIRLVENKNIKASPIQRGQALLKNSGNALIDNTIVTQDDGVVNTEYMQNPEKNSDRRTSTVADDAETSSQDYLEMIAETKAKKESNATLVEKLLNERGTRIDGTSVPHFLKNLIASYESEAWYGNVEKKYHELFDKVYSGKGGNIDVKTVTDMFRDIATDIFNSAFE